MGYINKMHRKRGITYLEVISSLFIITIIFTLIFPFISRDREEGMEAVTNRIISDLKYGKSLAISKDSPAFVKFLEGREGGYTKIEIWLMKKKYKEYQVPDRYRIIVNYSDLDEGQIVFNPSGALNHRATTLKVKNTSNNKTHNITLTIGFTRIMRIS